MSFSRMAGVSGIAFLILIILNAVLLGDQPFSGDDVDEVRDYIEGDEGLHKTAMFLGIVLLPFAILFFAGVANRLRASDREHGEAWAIAAIASAIFIGAAAGIGDALISTLIFRGGEGLSDSTIRAIWDAQTIAYSSTGIAVTGLTLSVAIPTVLHRVWPLWHAALGAIAAVLGVLAIISIVSATTGGNIFGLIGFVGLLVWVLATSVLLILEPEATS